MALLTIGEKILKTSLMTDWIINMVLRDASASKNICRIVEYAHTHNHQWPPLKTYFIFIRANLEKQFDARKFCEIKMYFPFQKPSLSKAVTPQSSSHSSKILNYLNQENIEFAKKQFEVWPFILQTKCLKRSIHF